ncbi:ATP-binding cassette domain-containing protein [Brachyspira pilosicoli]|uniref:ATP-binding cassette domain-containing protein n=1 Tax=Brachyspira pilosicoli TaxID=52584 RepID=A0AAJ6GHG6_BRAPL|nr:ATP-binding cassette domain-containing protein [Brachyspira pilosicoli]WIH90490.1 ATP-binding cassette domain-containing protein [Brachyspira pilosicoli]WIH92781.1 ATP-binding cassette domain-containing protein [Brachyspira pilosicoli]WIH95070.1 ATP-binding cassette domain-containing protein [Brachyspira pilosicoli]
MICDDKEIVANVWQINNINLSYNDNIIFKNFSISLHINKINIILGSSGCGKTSLLNIIAKKIESPSFVYQEPRLLNHLNAYENINYILKDKIKNKKIRDKTIKEALTITNLIDNIHNKPNELSGGMKQRLSLARALAYNSDFLLMDEPLQGQDIKRKKELLDIIKNIQIKTNKTIIYVTHDISEALILGDYIYILSKNNNSTNLIFQTKLESNDLNNNIDMQSKLMDILINN